MLAPAYWLTLLKEKVYLLVALSDVLQGFTDVNLKQICILWSLISENIPHFSSKYRVGVFWKFCFDCLIFFFRFFFERGKTKIWPQSKAWALAHVVCYTRTLFPECLSKARKYSSVYMGRLWVKSNLCHFLRNSSLASITICSCFSSFQAVSPDNCTYTYVSNQHCAICWTTRVHSCYLRESFSLCIL